MQFSSVTPEIFLYTGLSDFLTVILEMNLSKEKNIEDSFESSIGKSPLWKSDDIRRCPHGQKVELRSF
jgi:hypothetical protein